MPRSYAVLPAGSRQVRRAVARSSWVQVQSPMPSPPHSANPVHELPSTTMISSPEPGFGGGTSTMKECHGGVDGVGEGGVVGSLAVGDAGAWTVGAAEGFGWTLGPLLG